MDPLTRHTVFVAVEELGDDLLGERLVKIGRILLVLFLDGRRM